MRIAILLFFFLSFSMRSMEQTTKNILLLGGYGSLDIRKNTIANIACCSFLKGDFSPTGSKFKIELLLPLTRLCNMVADEYVLSDCNTIEI